MEGTTPQTPPDSGSGTAILPPPGQSPQTQPGGPTNVEPPGPGGPGGGGGGGGGGGDGRDGGWEEPKSADEGRKIGWLIAALIALGVLAVVLIVILVMSGSDDEAAETTTTTTRERPTTTTTTAPPIPPTAEITAANTTVTCAPNASAVGTQISWLTTNATNVVVTGPSPFNKPQEPFKQTAPSASGVGIAPSQECTAAPFTDQYTIVAENSAGQQATASASIQWLAAP